MIKPSIEQIAWVFKHLADHLDQGGNFNKMLERLDLSNLSKEVYDSLVESGAVEVVNILNWASMLETMVDTIEDDFEVEFIPEKKKDKPNGPN